MSILSALKQLTGSSSATVISEQLRKKGFDGNSGYHFLPDPAATGADAGKVPVVQKNGSYALEEAGGSGGAFMIRSDPDDDTLDKTIGEIVAAIQSGKWPILDMGGFNTLAYGYLVSGRRSYVYDGTVHSIFFAVFVEQSPQNMQQASAPILIEYTFVNESDYPARAE